MNKICTKIYALCIAVCLIVTVMLPTGVFAASVSGVISVNETTGMVYAQGVVDEYISGLNEAYIIIPRDGYTYDDFASADTIEESMMVTLYIGLVPVSQTGSYEYSFVAEGVKKNSPIYLSYNGEVNNINVASDVASKTLVIKEEFSYNPGCGDASIKILYAGHTYEDYLLYGDDVVLHSATAPVSEDGTMEYELVEAGNILPSCILVFTYDGAVKYRNIKDSEFRLHIYVDAANGSDTNSGFSKASALRTVAAAQNLYSTYANVYNADIILCEGTYPAITLDVNPGEGKNLTYKNAPGEKAVISGMTKLNLSDFSLVSDLSERDRFKPEARLNIYELDLADYGITTEDIIGDRTSFYGARDLSMAQIYLNGKPQKISRLPNSGYLDVTFASEGVDENTSEKMYSITNSNVKNWQDVGAGAYLEGFFNLRSLVYLKCYAEPISTDNDKLVFYNPLIYTKGSWEVDAGRAGKIAICNLPEEVDVPGEWCVNTSKNKLYYYMPSNIGANDTLEIALSEQNLISGTNVSDTTIDGLTITGSRSELVNISSADRVTIRNCIVENGRYGISFSGRNNIVENNSVRYTKGTAIWLRGGANAETMVKSENIISNNHVYACGTCGVADGSENSLVTVRLGTSTSKIQLIGDVVENNIIHANPYGQGIMYFGMDIKIRGNEIYNQLRYMSDAGVIYTGAKLNQYGSVIEGNYIHDFSNIQTGISSGNTVAIYWDDWHSGQTAINNIIVGDSGSSQRGLLSVGMNSTAKDNIVVNTGKGMIVSDRRSSTSFTMERFLAGVYKSFDNATDAVKAEYPQISEAKDAIDAIIESTSGKEFYPYSGNVVTGNFHVNVADAASSATAISRGTVKDNINISRSNLSEIFENPAEHDWRVKESFVSSYSGNISASLPRTSNFSMDSIGLQNEVSGTENADRSFSMYTPVIYDTSYGKTVVLSWEKALFADSYTYEVATDSSFRNIVASGSTLDDCAQISDLAEGTSYFWRVTAVNNSKDLGASYTADEGFGSFTLSAMELGVSDIKLYDAENNRITELKDIVNADYITYTVTNGARYPISYELIVVIKDSETGMVKHTMACGEVQDAEAGSGTDYAALIPPTQYTAGDEICIFIWDGLGTLKPLAFKTLIK